MELSDGQQKIIKSVHEFVKNESLIFSEDDVFNNHILGVKDFAVQLSEIYNANLFVTTLASYLHDIHYIRTKDHRIHEIEGAKFAIEYLKKYSLPIKDIELISKCILNHRGSKNSIRLSLEEKIISSSDAMDHINRIQHMFYRVSQKKSYEDSIDWIRKKIKRGWEKIELPVARAIIREEYEIAKIFFSVD